MIDWSVKENRFLLGDCIDYMATMPDGCFDLAITDPPYGIRRDKGFGGFEGFGGFGKPITRKQYKGEWDECSPSEKYFVELQRIARFCIVWGGNFFTDKLPKSNHWIFWDKLNTMPTFGDGELAWTNINRNSVKRYVLEYNGLLGKEHNRIHPTQKPVALYRWLLQNYAKHGWTILSTHGGSASDYIACLKEGFTCTWIEKDEDYYRDADKRVKQWIDGRSEEMFAPEELRNNNGTQLDFIPDPE